MSSPGRGKVLYFQNLIDVLRLHTTHSPNSFKLDGIIVTHPHSDHLEGVDALFARFPPNVSSAQTFEFKGPLLLTRVFGQKDSPNYDFIHTQLQNASFAGHDIGDGVPIAGFETLFTFSYPVVKATGVVYNYEAKPPHKDRFPEPFKGDFDSNRTSILMLINNPCSPDKSIISLNGDALGGDVLHLVKDEPLKVFKVPHHGSRYNSIPLTIENPKSQAYTKKMISAQALIELIKVPKSNLADSLVVTKAKRFNSSFPPKKSMNFNTNLNKILYELAKKFVAELGYLKLPCNAEELLGRLQERKTQIEENITDGVAPKDVYTKDVSDLQFTAVKYGVVKNAVIEHQAKEDDDLEKIIQKRSPKKLWPSELPYRKSQIFGELFKYLENDEIFMSQLYIRSTTEFYSHINAETYFISAGNLHDHPHFEVISGIIEAAKKRRDGNKKYKCRLLLTSGQNINESLLPSPVSSWVDIVSLQFFLSSASSVTIDPSISPDQPLDGTEKWNKPNTMGKSIVTKYNGTKGAATLKRKLAELPSFHKYEITSNDSSWLCVSHEDNKNILKLSSGKKDTYVTVISYTSHSKSSDDEVYELSLQSISYEGNQPSYAALAYGIVRNQVPGQPVDVILFIQKDGQNQYLVDENGTLQYSKDLDKGTYFSFSATAIRGETSIPAKSDGSPIAETNPLQWPVQSAPHSFDTFLQAIRVSPPKNGFSVLDAVILLLQSESAGYVVLVSFPRLLISKILDYGISTQNTTVAFAYTPTNNVILSGPGAKLVPIIQDHENTFEIGLSKPVTLKELTIYIKPPLDTCIIAEVAVGSQDLQISATMNTTSLPSMQFKFGGSLCLSDILSFLDLDSTISNLYVPVLSSSLKDLLKDTQITEAGFNISQAVDDSDFTILSSVFLSVQITNLSSYLPAIFASLEHVVAHTALYFPANASARKVGFKATFTFKIQSEKKTAPLELSAILNADPILGISKSNEGYNIEVSIGLDNATDLSTTMTAFGLENALSCVMKLPFVESLLQRISLKELTLALDTKMQQIHGFTLHILIPDWELVPKVSLTVFDLYMNYSNGIWEVAFEGTATFAEMYLVNAKFELSASEEGAVLKFKNTNLDFSIATFLEVFGLGSISDIPIIKTSVLLQTSITDVYLYIAESTNTSTVSIRRGGVSLYVEELDLSSHLSIYQVNLQVSITKEPTSQSYSFNFLVSGFITDSLHLNVCYDSADQVLVGEASVASFQEKETNLASVIKELLPSSTSSLGLNALYGLVSVKSISGRIRLALKVGGGSATLQHLMAELEGKLSLATSLHLTSLQFECLQTTFNLTATLSSGEFQLQVIFNLNKDTSGTKTLMATLHPSGGHTHKLSSFLSLLGITAPTIPHAVAGQTLPDFLDFQLTSGSIMFALSPLKIVAFDVQVQTPNTIQLLVSPKIELEKLVLGVKYESSSSTTAYLGGVVSLAGATIELEATKKTDGFVFGVINSTSAKVVDFQTALNQLTPFGSKPPDLPTAINLPPHIAVGVQALTVSLLSKEKSFQLCGESPSLNWTILLGLHAFTVNKLGGLISYSKMLEDKEATSYEAMLTGQFQYSSGVNMASRLHFGHDTDSILIVTVKDSSVIQIGPLVDKILGFDVSNGTALQSGRTVSLVNLLSSPMIQSLKDAVPFMEPVPSFTQSMEYYSRCSSPPSSKPVAFENLLPLSTESLKYSSAFMNLNITKSQFYLAGELGSIGTGFLFAGKFKGNPNYGYALGICLPSGFKFSHLIQDLSIIDDILLVRKANVVIFSLDGVKATDFVAAMRNAEKSFIYQGDNPNLALPFSNLTLDSATGVEKMGRGMSFYAEIDFNAVGKNSIFSSIVKVAEGKEPPNIILSAQIASEPKTTQFEAHIKSFTLLGKLEFKNVSLVYSPQSENSLTLEGVIDIDLPPVECSFQGVLASTNTKSVFTVANSTTISEAFGMTGITLHAAKLSLIYDFSEKEPSIKYAISGSVDFFSGSSPHSKPPPPPNHPTITLDGHVLFSDLKPMVVSVYLNASKPLTISDFVATVFQWHYDSLQIGLTGGSIYYASLPEDVKSVKIMGETYTRGYHISAKVEIFSYPFNIIAGIDKNAVTITGQTDKAIDLDFAMLAGVKPNNGHSVIDQSRGPKLSFTTTSTKTSISLIVGLILFESPFAVVSVVYNATEKIFGGSVTYSGDIGFMHNPSLDFQWSKSGGFSITKWFMSAPFPFDFFEKLKMLHHKCGNMSDLNFDSAVNTKFSVNAKLVPSQDPKAIAEIAITGSYDITLDGKARIADIPLPEIPTVVIPKEKHLTLATFPQFVLDLFTEYAIKIVNQLIENPKELSKILGLVALNSITKAVMGSLKCRGVEEEDIDPDAEGDDPNITKNGSNKVSGLENEVDKTEKATDDALNAGDLTSAASAAASFLSAVAGGLGILSGILHALVSILHFFHIDVYSHEQSQAQARYNALMAKRNKLEANIMKALDIGSPPSGKFTPPDTLLIQWHRITQYKGAMYHVSVTGILISLQHGQPLQDITKIFDEVVAGSEGSGPDVLQCEVKSCLLYRAIELTVTVCGNITGTHNNQSHTFSGPKYRTSAIPNVHPTLHAPAVVTATFDSSSFLIVATASPPVQLAKAYFFQLGYGTESSFQVISHCSFNSSSDPPIQCTFPHSVIPDNSTGPFRVRCQALAKANSDTSFFSSITGASQGDANTAISSSACTYSHSLLLASPVNSLTVTLPHFGIPALDSIKIAWSPPTDTKEVSGVVCQVVQQKQNSQPEMMLLSNHLVWDGVKPFPVTKQFSTTDVANALASKGGQPSDAVNLCLQVSSIGKNNMVIASVFNHQVITSLKAPSSVSICYKAEKEALEVSWLYNQLTNNYSIIILNDESKIIYSNTVNLSGSDEGDDKMVGYSISENILTKHGVSDPGMKYHVEVISVGNGNKELDSLIATSTQQNLQVLSPPVGKSLEFSPQSNEITVHFTPVPNANTYSVGIATVQENKVLHEVKVIPPVGKLPREIQGVVSINSFIQSLSGGDKVQGLVQSVGSGAFLSSAVSYVPNAELTVLYKPKNLTYNYSEETEQITLKCDVVPDIQNYTLGFTDSTKKIKNKAEASGESVTTEIEPLKLRYSGVAVWTAFAQATGDSTHLSSPLTLLSPSIVVLAKPIIQTFSYSGTGLHSSWEPIMHVSSYSVLYQVSTMNGKNKYHQRVNPTSTPPVTVRFNGIPNWPSCQGEVKSITITATACGSGYFITSQPSELSSLERLPPPQGLQYQYDPQSNSITLSCNLVPGISTYTLGFSDPTGEVPDYFKEPTQHGTSVSATFSCEHQLLTTTEWQVFAQSIGGSTNFSSQKAYLRDTVHILSQPEIDSITYKVDTTNLSITCTCDPHASGLQFDLKAVENGSKVKLLHETVRGSPPSTSLTVTMSKTREDWASFLSQLSAITVAVTAIGFGYYITGPGKSKSIDSSFSVAALDLGSDGMTTITWDTVKTSPASCYVYITINDTQVLLQGVSTSAKIYKTNMQILTSSIHSYDIMYSIKVMVMSAQPDHDLHDLPSLTFKNVSNVIRSSCIGTGGSHFDDDVMSFNPPIMKINQLWIRSGNMIDSIRAEYMLTDGSTVPGSKHGGDGGSETNITFNDGHEITGIFGFSQFQVSELKIGTRVTTGNQSFNISYGPYGSAGTRVPFAVLGKVIGLFGRSGDQLNSIGFYHILPHTVRSKESWGQSDSLDKHFGADLLADLNFPNPIIAIFCISKIWITYTNSSILSIQVEYLPSYTTPIITPQDPSAKQDCIKFSEIEFLVTVNATVLEDKLTGLELVTWTESGGIVKHGPYGSVDQNNLKTMQELFIGFFGQYSDKITSIGFYYVN